MGEWEAYAKRMIHPNGWKVRLSTYDTGTGVMSFDPNTGIEMFEGPEIVEYLDQVYTV